MSLWTAGSWTAAPHDYRHVNRPATRAEQGERRKT